MYRPVVRGVWEVQTNSPHSTQLAPFSFAHVRAMGPHRSASHTNCIVLVVTISSMYRVFLSSVSLQEDRPAK